MDDAPEQNTFLVDPGAQKTEGAGSALRPPQPQVYSITVRPFTARHPANLRNACLTGTVPFAEDDGPGPSAFCCELDWVSRVMSLHIYSSVYYHPLNNTRSPETMYPIGFLIIFARLFQHATLLNVSLVLIATSALALLYVSYDSQSSMHDVPSLPGFFLFNVFPFFRQRFDFIQKGFKSVPGHALFRFRLLRVSVGLAPYSAALLTPRTLQESRSGRFGRKRTPRLLQRQRLGLAGGLSCAFWCRTSCEVVPRALN